MREGVDITTADLEVITFSPIFDELIGTGAANYIPGLVEFVPEVVTQG